MLSLIDSFAPMYSNVRFVSCIDVQYNSCYTSNISHKIIIYRRSQLCNQNRLLASIKVPAFGGLTCHIRIYYGALNVCQCGSTNPIDACRKHRMAQLSSSRYELCTVCIYVVAMLNVCENTSRIVTKIVQTFQPSTETFVSE